MVEIKLIEKYTTSTIFKTLLKCNVKIEKISSVRLKTFEEIFGFSHEKLEFPIKIKSKPKEKDYNREIFWDEEYERMEGKSFLLDNRFEGDKKYTDYFVLLINEENTRMQTPIEWVEKLNDETYNIIIEREDV